MKHYLSILRYAQETEVIEAQTSQEVCRLAGEKARREPAATYKHMVEYPDGTRHQVPWPDVVDNL
jgi:hypothetical protein